MIAELRALSLVARYFLSEGRALFLLFRPTRSKSSSSPRHERMTTLLRHLSQRRQRRFRFAEPHYTHLSESLAAVGLGAHQEMGARLNALPL
jgi:hypothetical protein